MHVLPRSSSRELTDVIGRTSDEAWVPTTRMYQLLNTQVGGNGHYRILLLSSLLKLAIDMQQECNPAFSPNGCVLFVFCKPQPPAMMLFACVE